MTVVWLLDIDGVVNARWPNLAETPWPSAPMHAKCTGLTVRWSPDLINRIRSIRDHDDVVVRWASTWCGYLNQLAEFEETIGLILPRAFYDRPQSKTWADMKVKAVLDELEAGNRVIWTDDDEVPAARRLFPVIAEAEAEKLALLIAPADVSGLQPRHLDEIETFIGGGS